MKKNKAICLFIGTTIALLFGCVGMETKRYVQGNNFYSENYPKMGIKINPDFKYIGVLNTEYEKESVNRTMSQIVKKDLFVFGQIGDTNRIKKGIIIEFQKLRSGYWLPDLHANMKNKIESSSMTVNGKQYQYGVNTNSIIDKDLNAYLQDKGYLISNLYLTKFVSRIVTRDQTILMHIIYAEDIDVNDDVGKYSITDWRNTKIITDEQRAFLNEFLDRSEKNIQIGSEGAGIDKSVKDIQTAGEGVSLGMSDRDTQIVSEGEGISKSETDIQAAPKEKDSDGDVNYNIFQPPKYKKFEFKINADLKYIGEFKKNYKEDGFFKVFGGGSGHGAIPVESTTYSFCQVSDRNLIKKGIFINYLFHRTHGEPLGRWQRIIFNKFKNKDTLDSTSLIIGKNTYRSVVSTSISVPLDDMNTYLGDKGYTLSNIYMVRILGISLFQNEKIFMLIFYIEDIHHNDNVGKYSINDWQSAIRLSNAQRTFLREFLDRSEKDIQILDYKK